MQKWLVASHDTLLLLLPCQNQRENLQSRTEGNDGVRGSLSNVKSGDNVSSGPQGVSGIECQTPNHDGTVVY